MRPEDVAAAAALEQETYAFPWTEGIFRDCLRVGYDCRVIDLDAHVVGYGIMSSGAGEAHILNVCVRRDLRCRGLGRRMIELLLDAARQSGMREAFLEVRPSNVPAVRLYQTLGFEQIGLRKGYYPAKGSSSGQPALAREDAMMFRLDLK
jgi:ribosomal-protein-alanine N-acetyltransferase